MSILLVGLNHRTAPVQVREQLAFSSEAAATALVRFRQRFPHSEAAILSTCNRVEMIVASDQQTPDNAAIVSFLAEARDLPVTHFRSHLYEFTGEQAVRHLFRVVSGLDAMVVGDFQIANQVKAAYALACETGSTGRLLNRLFHHAFTVGKRVRSETDIGLRKVSVPSVAVDVAQQIFSDLSHTQVLVVGAGETAELICRCMAKAGVTKFMVTSRTIESAQRLADKCGGEALTFTDAIHDLARADILVTATNCPHTLIDAEEIRQAQKQRRGRPMYLIDVSVPRNIDPAASSLAQVFLYDIDALGRIVTDNQNHRESQLPLCETILDQEIDAFERWMTEARVQPLISQMYTDASELRELELARMFTACDDLSDDQRQAVRQLADRLINKLMHPCAHMLREHSGTEPPLTLARALRDLTDRQRTLRK